VVVVGASLAGLAAAVRLARVGHHVVVLDRRTAPAGEPWLQSPVVELPAAWRDVFRKSGRILDAALAVQGYELVPAPPTLHEFSDGSSVDLPTDRGQQYVALARLAGDRAASAWRDLFDAADDTWQLVRRAGLETEADLADPRTARLLADPRTVESEAARLPDPRLADLVRAVAWQLGSTPEQTPYWLLSRLVVQRTFGRWLVTRDGVPQPSETLTGLLGRRVRERGVEVRWGVTATAVTPGSVTTDATFEAAAVVSAVGYGSHVMLTSRTPATIALPRRLGPFRVGTRQVPVERPMSTMSVAAAGDAPVEVVRHRATGITTTWTLPGRTVVSTGAPCPSGLRWHGPGTVAAFHPLDDGVWYAGSGSIGGTEPWARLLTGALATYRVHEQITGADIHPSNKAYRP
jgi:glycine/D-amino acid oxidase-like deaminating enzyme